MLGLPPPHGVTLFNALDLYNKACRVTHVPFVHRLQIIVNATSGGYKHSLYYSNRRENYIGLIGNRTVTLNFDLQRPTHCIETTTCTQEDKQIDVGSEISKEVVIKTPTINI